MNKLRRIRQRTDGLFEGRVMIDGFSLSVYGKNQNECHNKLDRAIRNYCLSLESSQDYTLGEWLNEFYKTYKEPNLTPSALKPIEISIRLHIPYWLKQKDITEIKAIDIQKALNSVSYTRTRLYVYDVMNSAFNRAYALKMINFNPMQAVEKVNHIRKQGSALTKDEQNDFLSKIKNHVLEPLFRFYLYTGLRRSEALGIQWSDVLTDKKLLIVNGTKTKTSKRIIPLFDCVAELLNALPKNDDKYIFRYSKDYVSHQFKKLCPAHKLHDLRHTFATRCLECGISIKVIQVWLGHTRLDTTSNIYTHILDSFQTSEAQKFSI